MTTPAGWYPDPSGAGGQLYFDGANWTDYQAVAPVQKRPVWPWILAGVLLFFGGCGTVLVVGSYLGLGSSSTTHTATKGEPVSDGTFQFVVTNFAKASFQEHPQPKGVYVIATLTVTNTGNQPHSFIVQNQKLIDAAGREYAADDMAAYSTFQETTALDIAPGLTLNVSMRFDAPKGVKLTAIELHESASTAGATVRL
ncbi:MAG: hypothetical protein QOC69_583 [Mycobacterium sp.]|jgi:hypothetical protein|nr:hypothetical protein [Mycobacterium sp.]